jgi:flagellar motor switch protein FliM
MKRQMSQQEIDAAFRGTASSRKDADPVSPPFDFSRLDQIPKAQLKAIRLLHENFARDLAANFSAFLRTNVLINLVSIEQISFSEFVESITTPTCIAYVRLTPFDGSAVLELNTTLLLNLIEILLGGAGKWVEYPRRTITDIEAALVQILLRITLQDLSQAWKTVTNVDFSVQSLASEPQWLNVIDPAEAVVVIAVEIKLGSNSGLLNLALPSIFIKRLRDNFEQLRQVRRAESTEADQRHVSSLIQASQIQFEATLSGGTITLEQFLNLKVDDVLLMGTGMPSLEGFLNGYKKWNGRPVALGSKRAFQISDQP